MTAPRPRSWWRPALTLAACAAVAWFIASRPRSGLSLADLRWPWLAAAVGTLPPLFLFRVWKWRLLLRGAAPSATYGDAFRSYLGAMSLGLVTPGRLGEYARGIYLRQPEAGGWRGAGLVLLDNWTDFLPVLAWATLGLALWSGPAGLAYGAALVLFFAPIRPWLSGAAWVTDRLPALWGYRERARGALEAARAAGWRRLAAASAAGFAASALEWAQASMLLGFLGAAVPPAWLLAGSMALISLAGAVQVTVAGLGVREGLAVVLLARIGIGPEAAALAAFLQAALNLILPGIAGLAVKPEPSRPS